MTLVFEYAVAVAVVFAAFYGITCAIARREPHEDQGMERGLGSGRNPEIHVLARARMGRGVSLVLVEVEGRRLLLGSTRSEWSALADLGAVRPEDEDPNPFDPIDAELNRAIQSVRSRRGWTRP